VSKLEQLADGMIGEYQTGFWNGKSCIIYVFTVKQILQKCWGGCMCGPKVSGLIFFKSKTHKFFNSKYAPLAYIQAFAWFYSF
jgi:hypothetical protein